MKGSKENRDDEKENDISTAVKGVLSTLQSNNNPPHNATDKQGQVELPLEKHPLKDLYELIEQHKNHLKFLKDDDMCIEAERIEIVGQVKSIFKVITNRIQPKCDKPVLDVSE